MRFESVICEMAAMLSRPQCVNFYYYLKFIEELEVAGLLRGLFHGPSQIQSTSASLCKMLTDDGVEGSILLGDLLNQG